CRTPIPPGAKVEVENAWPSGRFDLLAAFDLAFPNGIDTLHGFRRPAFATPWFQRVVRRLAGTGTLPSPRVPSVVRPGRVVEAKSAVIGAGLAGRACAERLIAGGERPVLLEREPTLTPVPGAEMLSGTTAVFLPPPQEGRAHRFELIASRSDGSALSVRTDRVVVAVGGYDASLWFAGSDRPGVLTAEGAERLSSPASPRFGHALVFGGGKRALEILQQFDGKVDAIVAPGTIAPELARRASELDVPLYPRTLLLGAVGRRRVQKVRLARRGGEAPPFEVDADAVILAHRRLPHPQLFFQAGARTFWRPDVGAYGPVVGSGGATTVPGLYAAGEVAGASETEDARRSGEAVAEALVSGVPWSAPVAAGPSEAHHELEGYYQELLSVGPGPGKVVICPCEDVLLPELLEATDRGYRGIEVIKRYTGVGTGLCQGRYCLPEALLVLAQRERRPVPEVGYITQRPPVVPTALGALAGLPESEGSAP
ncbi:MAG: FAD-dependent oxidoreductase, partial [Thermoplasmata archaeon]|nr:FAD-dependent oxidoreductase [Thermoplasmata archaeon]